MAGQIRNICNNKCVDFVVRMVATDDEDLQPTEYQMHITKLQNQMKIQGSCLVL